MNNNQQLIDLKKLNPKTVIYCFGYIYTCMYTVLVFADDTHFIRVAVTAETRGDYHLPISNISSTCSFTLKMACFSSAPRSQVHERRPYICVFGSSHARSYGTFLSSEFENRRRSLDMAGVRLGADVHFITVPGGGAVNISGHCDSIRHPDYGYMPNVVVVFAGSNDSRFHDSLAEYELLKNLTRMICATANSDRNNVRTQVLLMGLLPRAGCVEPVVDRKGPRTPHQDYNRWAARVNGLLFNKFQRGTMRNLFYNRQRISFVPQPSELCLRPHRDRFPDFGRIAKKPLLQKDGVHLTEEANALITEHIHGDVVEAYRRSLRL